MLKDASWLTLAEKHERLCASCMFARARERGVRLALADLEPQIGNLFGMPVSWFDRFCSISRRQPPADVDEWRQAATDWIDDQLRRRR